MPMNQIAKEYEETSATVLELATKYRKSAKQITDILSRELGSKKFSNLIQTKGANAMAAKTKTAKTAKTAKTEENEFFRVNDRVQWFPDGKPRVIGVITKLFKDKCWLQPAGVDGVGEVITGVLLDQLELYSDAPGPIETALAELGGKEPEGDRSPVLDDNEEELELDLDQSANTGTLINAEEAAEESAAESESNDFGLFWLPIAAIAEHPDFQPRGKSWQINKGINEDVVDQYIEWLEYSEPPAIEVWHGQIGDEEGWWLVSGHHRIRALSKAKRNQVQCFKKATNHEEAIYRAAISNAGGGDRTRQIYKMSRDEWGEACKQFLRVCDRLSEEAIREFLDEAVAITGKSKTWNKINDSAIAAVFGISRTSVQNYQKQVDLEKATFSFSKGTRVLLTNYTELQLLGDRKYRLGVVNSFDANNGLHIIFDYARCHNNYYLPGDLLKVDDPLYEKPTKFKVGDRLWHEENGYGIVVSIESVKSVPCLKMVDDENPLIMWESGRHSANGLYRIDYEGYTKLVPSVDERLSRLIEYIAVDLKDEPEESFLKINAVAIHRYLSGLPVDEPTSTKQEEKGQRKELLGRSLPAGGGMNDSELPDVTGTNGKHPEDPTTVAVGPLERPPEATGLEQAREEARKTSALNRYNDLLFDLEVIPDEGLEQLIKLSKIELAKRRRASQEEESQEQELKAC